MLHDIETKKPPYLFPLFTLFLYLARAHTLTTIFDQLIKCHLLFMSVMTPKFVDFGSQTHAPYFFQTKLIVIISGTFRSVSHFSVGFRVCCAIQTIIDDNKLIIMRNRHQPKNAHTLRLHNPLETSANFNSFSPFYRFVSTGVRRTHKWPHASFCSYAFFPF